MSARKLAGEVAALPLFKGVSPAALQRMCDLSSLQTFEPGEILMEDGRLGTELYVILSGSVRVDLPGGRVVHSGPGETVGEMALMEYNRRSATVTVDERLRALVVHGSVFHQLLVDFPEVRERIDSEVSTRIRNERPAQEV